MTVGRVYFFSGSRYTRFDSLINAALPVYPRDIAASWPGLFGSDIDAAVAWDATKVYFFKGNQYSRYDVASDKVDPGYPKPIAGNWPGIGGTGYENGIDAAVNWGNGKVYWFKGDTYMRIDLANKGMDPGYPKPIAGNWPGVAGTGFDSGIDAIVNYGNGKVYWFKADQYLRVDGTTKAADPGYPKPIAGNWPGVFTSGISAAVEWPIGGTPATPTRFVRRSVWSLRSQDPWDPITLAYARAVRLMQSKPITDPTSWSYQAAMHGSYATPPPGALWNECQHASWFFLPWHRMYVYYLERIVRAAVISQGGPADFALPYWNYDQGNPTNTLPLPFREATLPDGSANPLFIASPGRATGIAGGAELRARDTSSTAAMATTVFEGGATTGFGGPRSARSHFNGGFGALESQPHNIIHVRVGGPSVGQCNGGIMVDPNCAALDPIFWLHHCNIDRLWNHWLASGGGRANPTDAAWLNEQFVFFDETGAQATISVAQVLSGATQLNYEYDDLPNF